MSSEWSLIEYRPGRYVKVTPDGDFLGKATEAEVKAWFSSQARLSPAIPHPERAPAGARPEAARTGVPVEHQAPAAEEVQVPAADPWPWSRPEPSQPSPLPPRQKEETEEAEAVWPGQTEIESPAPEPTLFEPEDALPQFDVVLGRALQPPIEPLPQPEIPELDRLIAHLKGEFDPAEAATLTEPHPEPETSEAEEPGAEVRAGSVAVEAATLAEPWPEPEAPEPEAASAEAGVAFEAGGPEMVMVDPGPGPETETAEAEEDAGDEGGPEEVGTVGTSANGHWLWVDPRQESGYQPASFDVAAFLQRAIALFQAKDWTGGQRPGRLAVHPSQAGDSLKAVAETLGLEVVSDPLVSPGTYRLGLGRPEKGN